MRADDAEAVEGDRGLLGLLGRLRWRVTGFSLALGGTSLLGRGRRAGLLLHVDVKRGDVHMRPHASVFALEFDRLLCAGDGIDGSAKDVALYIAVQIACRLLHFD